MLLVLRATRGNSEILNLPHTSHHHMHIALVSLALPMSKIDQSAGSATRFLGVRRPGALHLRGQQDPCDHRTSIVE